jgi:D-threo-aldose 1-dehydrogenase
VVYDGGRVRYAPAPAGLIDRAQRIGTVCARYGVPIGAAAIRLVLRHPAVTAVVVGARTVTEVTKNVSYLAATVPAELFGELAAERLTPDDGLMPAHRRQAPDQ